MVRQITLALVVSLLCPAVLGDHRLCGQYETYSEAYPYIFNNNAWNKDDSGFICTFVSQSPTASHNAWYSLWQWTAEPPVVRAYPQVQVNSTALPMQIEDLSSLKVAASWTLAPSSLIPGASKDPTTEPDASALAANGVNANVVIDMFADADRETSQKPAKQGYEIMVWLARFGDASQPIGNNSDNDPLVATVNGVDFTLYHGTNANGQQVFSWVAESTMAEFDIDVAPLTGSLVSQNLVPKDIYIGVVQFGSETFYASAEMNFSVTAFSADVKASTGGDGSSPSESGTASLPTATLVPHPPGTHKGAASPRFRPFAAGILGYPSFLAAVLFELWGLTYG